MSVGKALARGRSHIIFIVALLTAAAYILWVEQGRGIDADPRLAPVNEAADGPQSTTARSGWRLQLGAFATAEAAGREWDRVRGEMQALGPFEVMLVQRGALVGLQTGPVFDQERAQSLCEIARREEVECLVAPPLRTRASSAPAG